ncbi:hypothetical protein DPMN_004114 [Dreissena polymorpha]|uniref:Uncharacterized protein n=1 Tax=Dreissena polymorpha TaxID=45954 RepID=A0A9D4MMX2_DREPO|nr:hypothetical protein DPMN_004114 [Dreissena polymorpha]
MPRFYYKSFIHFAECVESFNFIKTTDLLLASAAEMHDCCTATGFATETVFDCVHNIGGLCEDYYYPSTYGQCRNNSCTPLAKVVPLKDFTEIVCTVWKLKNH